MADNSTQSGADTIATDDVTLLNGAASSGVKVPRNKMTFGDDGTSRDVSATFPLPVDTELPAAAALADAMANPTAPSVGSGAMLFNGTTWDRMRNNIETVTGDSGVKTLTFNGAAQTNYNHRGAFITVRLGTVTGVSPTLNAQLQFSPDGGTTWFAIGAASSNVTTSNNSIAFIVYPSNTSVAGATPGALALGTTTQVLLNVPLPRTWRIAFTIGGTTPSFTITAVNVNYLM